MNKYVVSLKCLLSRKWDGGCIYIVYTHAGRMMYNASTMIMKYYD